MDFQVRGNKQSLRLGAADSQPNQFESHHLQSAKKQLPNFLQSTVPWDPFHENAEDTPLKEYWTICSGFLSYTGAEWLKDDYKTAV